MPFIPLAQPRKATDRRFPHVSEEEQAARDAEAQQILLAEFDQDMPGEARAALESEYRQRFGKEPPTTAAEPVRRGFVPLAEGGQPARGFVPIEQGEADPPAAIRPGEVLRNVLMENPLTATGETVLNLGTQMVALPVAGIAGLATEAGRALGLTERTGADVIQAVGDALTYQPRGSFGQSATDLATKPFQALAEVGQAAGGKVLDVTGSPAAATAVDTAIQVGAPMAIVPGARAAKRAVKGEAVASDAPAAASQPRQGFTPLDESATQGANPALGAVETGRGISELIRAPENQPAGETEGAGNVRVAEGERRLAGDPSAVRSSDEPGLQALRREGDPDGAGVAGELRDFPGGSGAADRPAGAGAVASDQARLAPGVGLESAAAPQPRVARYALVEAGDLKPSTFREAPDWYAREKSIQAIVGEFDPRRLVAALDDADGAPIIRRDGTVEAGQKRAEALARIWQANGAKAQAYRQHLRENAAALGLDPAAVDSMKKPVLVRVPDEAPPAGDVQPMAAGVQNGAWNPGAQYAPFVDQMRAPASHAASVADLPAPKRREHIVKRFADAIGTTIYEGRVKGKNRLGFFRPRNEEVRIKRANDLEVTAHEVAHLIDKRVPAIANAWRSDRALREELKSVSYDRQSVPEGFAEGVRLYLTQPETLEARAPRVFNWLEDFTRNHEYGPALKQAQAEMTAWFGQDALNRARSKIGSEKPLAEYFDRFWDKFRQATVDDLHGIYQMERSLTGGKIDANGAYESARLSRASASIADGAVRFGYPVKQADGAFKFAGKGLEEILNPVSKHLDDALLYFVGRSAHELSLQGREHLFTRGEIDAMLRLRTPERVKAFEEYQAWNRGVLDFAQAQGVINPEARRLWQRTQYLPFHRVDQPGGLKGKPGDWAGVQALTGGTTNLKDILGNMIGNTAMLLDKAVKNEARLKVAEMADTLPGAGKFMVKIDSESRPVKISGDQVLNEMFKRYGIAIDGDAPAFFEFLIKGQPPAGNNVVAVLKGGKPVWYEVGDPILYRALKAIDRPLMNQVVKVLGWPKRIGQASITTTPEFWVANMARDTLMGAVMSRAGFRPVLDSLQGMRARMSSDPAYREFIANGGGLASIFLDESNLRAKLERYYRDQGIDYKTVLDTPDKLLTFIETLGDAFEMSTRLGEYKRATARGENPRHAAYLGREVSTDFAMRGDSKALGFMYDTVMFLKPAVLSWDRLYRGLAHDPNQGAIAAKAGMMAVASAALYLLNRDDPRYVDLADWDRDANWHFFVGDQHFRWPKIWEIGALSSAAERSVEKIIAADPQGLGKDFARILGATFNVNLMPQLLAPLYEQGANRNSFTKAPIETPGMENVQPFLRAKPGTSETMKAAGMATRDLPEALQVNPARAEALLRGYFNTWAMYGLMLTDQAFHGDKLAEKRTDELPVVRRFYAQEPARHTKYEAEFYDLLQEAKRLRGTLRELDDRGLRELADQKEQGPMAGEAKPLERAAKHLSAINNEMEQVRRSEATPAEKRRRLDALIVERNALLKAAVLDSKTAQKEKSQP